MAQQNGLNMTPDQIRDMFQGFAQGMRVQVPGADRRLPPFSTTDGNDWIAWRRTFESVRRLKGWEGNNAVRYIQAAMEGAACRMVADIQIADDEPNWVGVLDRYEARFMPAAQGRLARQLFKEAKQKELEPVVAWHTRLREMYLRAHPGNNAETSIELIEGFLLGLQNAKVREEAYKRLPQTMADALTYATDAVATVHCLRQVDGSGRSGIMAMKEEDGELAAMQDGCWSCGAIDHIRRNCPKPGKKGGPGRGTPPSANWESGLPARPDAEGRPAEAGAEGPVVAEEDAARATLEPK